MIIQIVIIVCGIYIYFAILDIYEDITNSVHKKCIAKYESKETLTTNDICSIHSLGTTDINNLF